MPVLGPVLLVCLSLVPAVPAWATGDPAEKKACEEATQSPQPLSEEKCEDPRGDATKPGGAAKGVTKPDDEDRSRADSALEDAEDRARSREAELDARVERIRRDAVQRREATRRRARSAASARSPERDSSDDGDADDGDAEREDEAREGSDDIVITAAGDNEEITLLRGRRDILVRNRALVRGYIPARRAGRNVVLEVRRGGGWVEVDRAKTIEDGKFYLAWYPSRPGYYRIRVRPYSTTTSTEPSEERLLYVYRRAVASWYGPGFYGNTTACGQRFTSRLLGVAHKTLPCGYRLTVRYRGRSRTVRVVDRGPFTRGRDYDLTEALRNYLRFDGVDEVLVTA